MTCIVGLQTESGFLMGADSAGCSGYHCTVRGDQKIFKNGPFVFAFTDSYRALQLMKYNFKPPRKPKGMSDEKFMTTVFVDAVRKCFDKGGYLKKKDGVEFGGFFLVGYRKRIYEVASDFQVGWSAEGLHAMGCGMEYALGSLYVSWCVDNVESDLNRVIGALDVAGHFSTHVSEPFVIMDEKGIFIYGGKGDVKSCR